MVLKNILGFMESTFKIHLHQNECCLLQRLLLQDELVQAALFHELSFLLAPYALELVHLVALVVVHEFVQQGEHGSRLNGVGLIMALFEQVQESILAKVSKKEALDLLACHNRLLLKIVFLEVGNQLALVLRIFCKELN